MDSLARDDWRQVWSPEQVFLCAISDSLCVSVVINEADLAFLTTETQRDSEIAQRETVQARFANVTLEAALLRCRQYQHARST